MINKEDYYTLYTWDIRRLRQLEGFSYSYGVRIRETERLTETNPRILQKSTAKIVS